MSITEELRNWAAGNLTPNGLTDVRIRDIADRIDEAHEKDVQDAKVGHLVGDFWYHVSEASDDALAEHGLVRLPVDADGVPIHIGDMMSVNFCSCSEETHGKAVTMELSSKEVDHPVWVHLAGGKAWEPDQLHHYRPTPAERIRKILRPWVDSATDDSGPDWDFNITQKSCRELLAIADELEGEGV